MSKAVYEATYAMPGMGVEVGDRIVVRPSHPTAPLSVVKRYGRMDMERFHDEGHADAFVQLHTEPSVGQNPRVTPRTAAPHLTLLH